jgi:hypothetical protein
LFVGGLLFSGWVRKKDSLTKTTPPSSSKKKRGSVCRVKMGDYSVIYGLLNMQNEKIPSTYMRVINFPSFQLFSKSVGKRVPLGHVGTAIVEEATAFWPKQSVFSVQLHDPPSCY